MTADLRIRVDPDGRLHLTHRTGRNITVEVVEERRGCYRWMTVPNNIETDISPTDLSREASE